MDILERLRRSVTKGYEPTDEDAIDAAAEIERLRAALEPFARQDVSKMLSLEELDLESEDFERARRALEQKAP